MSQGYPDPCTWPGAQEKRAQLVNLSRMSNKRQQRQHMPREVEPKAQVATAGIVHPLSCRNDGVGCLGQ